MDAELSPFSTSAPPRLTSGALAVSRPSGGPQLTVMWFHWDDEAFYMSTTRDRSKYPNIARDPQIALLVNDQAAHRYIAAYGRAELIEDGYERIALLATHIFAKYLPSAPARCRIAQIRP